jgi:hypothetical protein
MMRNIKFRVWDEKYNCWDYEPVTMIPGQPILKQGRVIQQWTGLLDINNKEIYEGDTVKFKVWEGSYGEHEYEEHTGNVTFEEGRFSPIYLNDVCEDDWYSYKKYDFEVIGNIFEKK